MGFFQNTYRGYKKYIVVHCIDVNRTVCFHPGGCQNNAVHLSLCQLTGIKDPFREKPLDGHSF